MTIDFEKKFCARGRRIQPSIIRTMLPLGNKPGMITLAGGLPNPTCFPFTEVNVATKDGARFTLKGPELASALQYSASRGVPAFAQWLKDFQKKNHNPPAPWDVMLGSGSQDFLSMSFDIFLDENDTLLLEEYTYPGAIAATRSSGCKRLGVKMDKDGIIPSDLRKILDEWDVSSPKPKILYLIPNGQNPTGSGMTLERKKEVYSICCQHDVIIIEDDPYYNLIYDESPPPSLLSLDTEGRVIRLDSFSKVLSAGIRLGWATASPAVIEKLEQYAQMSILHANSFSQVAVHGLLREWGEDGWKKHVAEIKALYRTRAQDFSAIARKHLTGLAEWDDPKAGMFLWVRLLGTDDSKELMMSKLKEKNVLIVPGSFFLANEGKDVKSPFIRMAFSVISPENTEEAMKRLAEVLRDK